MSIITYSAEELASGLGCTPRWLTEQARCGRIPGRRVAKQWRFTEQDCVDIITLLGNGFCKPEKKSEAPVTGLTRQSQRRLMRIRPANSP